METSTKETKEGEIMKMTCWKCEHKFDQSEMLSEARLCYDCLDKDLIPDFKTPQEEIASLEDSLMYLKEYCYYLEKIILKEKWEENETKYREKFAELVETDDSLKYLRYRKEK